MSLPTAVIRVPGGALPRAFARRGGGREWRCGPKSSTELNELTAIRSADGTPSPARATGGAVRAHTYTATGPKYCTSQPS